MVSNVATFEFGILKRGRPPSSAPVPSSRESGGFWLLGTILGISYLLEEPELLNRQLTQIHFSITNEVELEIKNLEWRAFKWKDKFSITYTLKGPSEQTIIGVGREIRQERLVDLKSETHMRLRIMTITSYQREADGQIRMGRDKSTRKKIQKAVTKSN